MELYVACAKSLIVRNNYPYLNKDIPMIFENNPHQMCTFIDKIFELYRTWEAKIF